MERKGRLQDWVFLLQPLELLGDAALPAQAEGFRVARILGLGFRVQGAGFRV